MKISAIMTPKPYVLTPEQTIAEAATMFLQYSIDGAPVTDSENLLLGLVGKRQLYNALAGGISLTLPVREIMITDVITCQPDDDIDTIIDKNFSRLPVIEDGKVVGIVTFSDLIRHFTSEVKDLKNVKLMMEQLDAVFEASYDYLFVTDADGKVTRVNQAYYRITGIKPEEVIGKTMYELVAQGFYDRSCSVEVIETLKPVTFIQKIKTGRTVLVTGNPVFDRKGNLVSVITNGRDITELNELKHAVEHEKSLNLHYKNELSRVKGWASFVVAAPVMVELMEKISHLAQFDSSVLITGESGVGKEIIAHQIHLQSPRSEKPYIRINCAAIPENLLESELFGYAEGAFTGARKGGKAGMFELANGGTLLLDEIADLPFSMQAKLLRVIQENEVTRIGSTKTTKIDVRIITSTNRDINEMVKDNQFREDLYYRLNVVPIRVPALRERREEIPALVSHFLNKYNSQYKLNKRMDPVLIDKLVKYDWPGNVRELGNVIERAIVTNPDNLIKEIVLESNDCISNSILEIDTSEKLRDIVQRIEKFYIETFFDKYGSTRKAAEALGISQSTFCRKAAMYNINLNGQES